MSVSWIIKRLIITSVFALVVAALHAGLYYILDLQEAFKEALITHVFLYFITLFVFALARKINDNHPDYTTEVMLGANAAKMFLVIGFFFIVYLNKIDGINFAYSFLGIYFLYLPFNAYLYLKHFKTEAQKKETNKAE